MSISRARLAALLVVVMTGGLLPLATVHAAGEPVGLAFAVQPAAGAARAPFSQQPVVRVVDTDGNTVTTSNAPVLLTAYGQGGTFGCPANPVRAINGVATFSGCVLFDGPKTGFRIRATSYLLDAAISEPFDIGPPGPEPDVRLVFDVGNGIDVGPFTATAAGPIWFDIRWKVVNASNQTITSGPASTLPITLSTAPNPEGATVACPGGNTVAAVAGVATFTGCSISKPGVGLHLIASADSVEPAWSFPIDVWPPGTRRGANLLSFTLRNGAITWGSPAQFELQLRPTAAGQTVAGRVVHIQRSDNPFDAASFRTIGDVTTDATGFASFSSYRPTWNHWYRAFMEGDADLGPALSPVYRVIVRHKLAVRPTTRGGPRRIPAGTTITFRAIVRPARLDTPPTKVIWSIRSPAAASSGLRTTTPDAQGVATLTINFTPGSWVIRARTVATRLNANSLPTYDSYIVR